MDKKSLSWILGLGAIAQIAVAAPISISGNDVALKFNPEKGEQRTLVMPDGKTVKYVAYERIYYVTNVEDSTYQYLNFYVPESALATEAGVPIFFRTYTGGYMATKAEKPSETDATGRALLEGYAVCIPGSRGWYAEVSGQNGKTTFTGRAPAGLVDLKVPFVICVLMMLSCREMQKRSLQTEQVRAELCLLCWERRVIIRLTNRI